MSYESIQLELTLRAQEVSRAVSVIPNLTNVSIEDKQDLLELVEELLRRNKLRKFYSYFPTYGDNPRSGYAKHLDFFATGLTHNQRAFIAANRVGKTQAGAFEVTCHATGIYPDWWPGIKFDNPVDIWIAGENSKTVFDILQMELLGKPSEFGTGMLPGETILSTKKGAGLSYMDNVFVKHISGGTSTIQMKSYSQGRETFQGTARHFIWLDEECPDDIYEECLLRTMTTNGQVMMTFTPLMGMTNLIQSFKEGKDPSKCIVSATWDDAPHLSEDQKKTMFASLPPHQRDARSRGIPQLGSGAVYPVPETSLIVPAFPIPQHWKRAYALDVGWNATAALWVAIDPESGVKYIHSEHKMGGELPIIHADAIKARGDWIPGVIDPASRGRGQDDGKRLFDQYVERGLHLEPAKNAVESGIYSVWEQLSTGKLKFFDNLPMLMHEFRLYRRDEKGHIIKKDDHLLDCLRYLSNSGYDVAMCKPVYSGKVEGGNVPQARWR